MKINKSVEQFKNNKAAWCDEITAKICKALGGDLLKNIRVLFHKILNREDVPQHFKNVVIVILYQEKGIVSGCNIYSRISLSSVVGKILPRIMKTVLYLPLNAFYLNLKLVLDRIGVQST